MQARYLLLLPMAGTLGTEAGQWGEAGKGSQSHGDQKMLLGAVCEGSCRLTGVGQTVTRDRTFLAECLAGTKTWNYLADPCCCEPRVGSQEGPEVWRAGCLNVRPAGI